MFHRRKRAQSNPHHFNVNGSSADSAATSAAALAFLSTQKSNANLAAAAAGAALRSRPTTPTNVAEVQTKRTQRRGSVSSSRSASVNGRPSSMLERRLSSGSMTDRIGTFREQSPNRGAAKPAARDAPPVPSIPASYSPVLGHGRSSSLQPAMRISSPAPSSAGRGSSLQPTQRQSIRRNQAPPAPERTDSRGSVNFSYPTSLQRRISDDDDRAPERLLTPVRPAIDLNEMVYDSNTRSFRSRGDLLLYEQRLRDAAQPPQRKRSVRKEGSHLAQGSVGGRMKVSAHAMEPTRSVEQPQQQEDEHILPRTMRHAPATDQAIDVSPRQDRLSQQVSPRKQYQTSPGARQRSNTVSDNDSDASEQRQKMSKKTLAHQPSLVSEVSEPEHTEDKAKKVLGSRAALRHASHKDLGGTFYSQTPTSVARKQQTPFEASVATPDTTQRKTSPQKDDKIAIPQEGAHDSRPNTESAKPRTTQEEPVRGSSLSPSGQTGAQFLSPAGAIGIMRHNPSRSISPMKSALKHTSSRGPSPLGENREGWPAGHGSADLSDASTSMSESKPVRKKSVRVSFDEGSNVVVNDLEVDQKGVRRIWSGGQHNFRNRSNSPMSEESEVMGPRPSLPVFGSVRKKKYVLEDRPLVVKPHETSNTSSIDMGSENSLSNEKKTFGPSSDHMVGAVLTQDFAAKVTTLNDPNPSKSREPLLPLRKSREDSGFQSGYHSSNESDDSDSQENAKIEEAVVVEIPVAEREALRTPEGHRKPRFIEDLSSESGTPTKETGSTLFLPENNERTALGPHRTSSSMGDPPLFTPPEDEDMLRLTERAAADAITHGMPPNLVVTVPTPIVEQEEWQPSMPGGLASWDSPSSTPTLEEQREISLEQYKAVLETTPAGVGIAEPEVVSHTPGAPVVGEIAAQAEEILTREQTERPGSASAASNRTEDESVYSDAAEHLTDTEGDGFMSLDAVVDSPVSVSPQIEERFVAPAPHSPTRTTQRPAMVAAQAQKEEVDGDWLRTQRYWASLSDEKKKQLEEEARRLAESEASATEDETIYTKKHNQNMEQKQKELVSRETMRMPPPPKMAPLQAQEKLKGRSSPDRTYQIPPGSKASPSSNGTPSTPPVAMASTMRQSLRKSRPEALESGRMRASLRGPPSAQIRARPASSSQYQATGNNYYQAGTGSLNASSRYSYQSAAPAAASSTAKPTPREQAIALVQAQQIAMRRLEEEKQARKPTLRRGSNDSDSSFKRARSGGNGFFAKTSMRGDQGGQRAASVGGPPQSDRSRKISVRSLSPVGRKGMAGGAMQAPSTSAGLATTLRSSGPAAQRMMTPSTQEVPKSLGFFGRKKAKSVIPSGGFGRSRFVDSDSDEDSPRPREFRSRFVDSDSDEDAPPAPIPPISMQNRSFRSKGVTEPNSQRPQSAIELAAGIDFGYMRPPNPRKPSKVLEEDSSDLEDIDDEETREKTRLNSIQGVEARAAAKGVHPEAVRLAQAYFSTGLLNTSEKYEGIGRSTLESTPVRQRNATPPGQSFTNTSQNSLSPGKTSVSLPNFHQDKKSPEHKKKGGLMSILSRKRKDKNDKVGKRAIGDSGARQDTPLERSRLDLEAARRLEDPPTPGGMAGPWGSKLRKKGLPQLERPAYGRAASGSFNVQVSKNSEIAPRPATSDGLGHTSSTSPRGGLADDSSFGHDLSHEKTSGPIDGVNNDNLLRPTYEKTSGPINNVSTHPLPQHSHETTLGPIDGVAMEDKPGVLRRGTSASGVNFEGKKKDKKKGFLRRMFDL